MHIMIKPQIIQENGKPKAVILEYKEYLKLKEMAEDKSDYHEAIEAEMTTKKWHKHEDIKRKLGLK